MNELIVSGWLYFPTDKQNTSDAVKDFLDACKKVGINADNTKAVLRDADGNNIWEG